MKLTVLSSYTTDLLVDAIAQEAAAQGLPLEVRGSPFGRFREEVIDVDSATHRFAPDAILFALRGEDLLAQGEQFLDLLREAEQRFAAATILVHNGLPFDPAALPLLSWNTPGGRGGRLAMLNAKLFGHVTESSRVRVLDLAGLAARHGTAKLLDPRMMYLAKHPFSADGTALAAGQVVRALSALGGKRRKCIVVDLDNTLWGGVLGEDGPAGLLLSDDGPGKAFRDFQAALLCIQQTGVLLAICSKNDEEPALKVLREHPGMVLQPEHFAAWRINWDPKAANIAALAEELNLGLDSFLFLDDSAQEREMVRQMLPHVLVPDLPEEPADLPAFAADLPGIDTLAITEADRARTRSYAQERQRRDARSSFGSMDEYIRSLGIRLTISRLTDYTLPRAAQLTQRTNQFNLTTRRYTEADLRALRERDDVLVCLGSAEDRFGNAGVVGLAIIKQADTGALLDTFLVSCRVLGRRIEDAFLSAVLDVAKRRGAKRCIAEFIPTERNAVARDFLPRHGFTAKDGKLLMDLTRLPTFDGIEVTHA